MDGPASLRSEGAGFAWSRWQPSRGPRGSVHVDWVAGIVWIGWQASRGLSGNLPMDWVADIRGICNQEDLLARFERRGCRGGCLIGNLSQELADHNPRLQAQLDAVLTSWRARYAQLFR